MFEAGRGNTSQCVSKECRSDLRGIAGLEGILIGPLGIGGFKWVSIILVALKDWVDLRSFRGIG